MLEKMKEIIAEQLGVEEDEITLDTSFKEDLGADSLDLFELLWRWKRSMIQRFLLKNLLTSKQLEMLLST